MPIYDYRCTACGSVTEVRHGINDPSPPFCPQCGAEGTLRKAFAPPTVHFKGSGWAKKDRASSTSSRPGSRDGAAASGDAGSVEAATGSPRGRSDAGGGSGAGGGSATGKPGSGATGTGTPAKPAGTASGGGAD